MVVPEKRVVCFDLEGPLSPQDNAYELMAEIPSGKKIFEVISRYDDILALEGRVGYEPGDTLALIVPFLVYHGITDEDIRRVSNRAYLVEGAIELLPSLMKRGWNTYIISTSYKQHALNIAKQLGIAESAVACTQFPLKRITEGVNKEELTLLSEVESHIVERLYYDELSSGTRDRMIKSYLDGFYWERLARTSIGTPNKCIEVMGGRRKVLAIEKIARANDIYLKDVVFVGDSITDAQGARLIEAAGGLVIAFNANAFVLPYATVGVASKSLADIGPVLDAWSTGGRENVKKVADLAPRPRRRTGPYYQWLVGISKTRLASILRIHQRIRKLVRTQAAKLG